MKRTILLKYPTSYRFENNFVRPSK